MKKIIKNSCILFVILFSLIYIFGEKQFSLKLNEIDSIEIFNGQTGKNIIIQDEEKIKKIIDDLNGISMECKEFSFLKSGYALRFSIYDSKGRKSESFIINNKNSVRRVLFTYKIVKGSLDYKYYYDLVERNT